MNNKNLLFRSVFAALLVLAVSFMSPAKGAALEIAHAKNFNIEYLSGDIKVVTDSEGRRMLLVPDKAAVPAGYEKMTLVRTPVKHALFTSTSYVGFLGKLGRESLYDSIAAVCTPLADWTVPQVSERMKQGKIQYIENSHMQPPSVERVIDLKPDIVFSGGGDISGAKLRTQLDEAKVKYMVIMDYTETGDGAYIEWIKFFGAFYNLDKEADRIYRDMTQKMSVLAKRASAVKKEKRPVVALGLLFNGVVYTQGGNSNFRRNIERAGGIYALQDLGADGGVQIGMEEFFEKCRGADILIYSSSPQYLQDKEVLISQNPLFAEFKAVKNDRVYIYDKGYYMNAAALDEKFEDIVFILNPQLMPKGYSLRHYQKLK